MQSTATTKKLQKDFYFKGTYCKLGTVYIKHSLKARKVHDPKQLLETLLLFNYPY